MQEVYFAPYHYITLRGTGFTASGIQQYFCIRNPFTVTIDKLEGCTTGVSAADRAATIRALLIRLPKPETFGRPGHVNPCMQEKG